MAVSYILRTESIYISHGLQRIPVRRRGMITASQVPTPNMLSQSRVVKERKWGVRALTT